MPSNNPVETVVHTRLRVAVYVAIILAAIAVVASIFSLVFLRKATTELQEARSALERMMPHQDLED